MNQAADAHTLSEVQQACLDQYELDDVQPVRELTGGMFNRPILLRAGQGLHVLRFHTFRRSADAFQFQAETVAWLNRQGIRSAAVTPTRDGAWCVPLPSGQGVAAVHDFVDGTTIGWKSWQRRKESEPGFLRSLGQHVGQLHNSLASARPGGDARLDATLPTIQFSHLGRAFRHWCESLAAIGEQTGVACTAARDELLQLAPRIHRHWQLLQAIAEERQVASLPRQVVHGDVSAVNIVWDEQDRPAWIDWDTVHHGHRLYDALGDVLNRVPDDRPDWNTFRQDHVEQYLQGYADALNDPLTEHEASLVPTFCLARQLEDLRQRLAGLATLSAEADLQYARLIKMRVDMMDQIELNLSP